MPESIEEYAARVAAAQDADGRIPIDPEGVVAWDVFPFETDGLRLKPGPVLGEERVRTGEDPATCPCATEPARGPREPFGVVWEGEHFLLKVPPPSGAPLMLSVVTREHLDVPDLSDDLAAAFGRLHVALVAAVEELPSVGRCHVMRIGDGGVHAHWWFLARPARLPLVFGSFMVDWDDFLPPVPLEVWVENATFVAQRLRDRLGGSVVGVAG
ncbi:hypothetical protein [Phycicoccus sonneratiae]|uniref:HIT domain-containing protein n=1 Tax=Phycicoccus sonneratiae TaxID=2807628 RepID=A0ABS2CJI7_9MICO|nr:hypothetical protein [Phycicoccus sonneraticus]MBM6400034.1 hypothetical protein [Phycicoccus sonneraticus]